MPAALAAEAAGEQGKFWAMHDKLFEHNKDLSDANIVKWAKEIGLDVPRFNKDLKRTDLADKIKEMQAQSKTLGALGTPAFFVNGRFLSGAQPEAKFSGLIDEELTKARALVAAGTPPSRVYAQTIAGGAVRPE